MTPTVSNLTLSAIKAAQESEWELGKELNSEILVQEPDNTQALNRLAFCQMQLNNPQEAKKLYEQVLTIERINPIATKYLSLLKRKVQLEPSPVASQEDFIEEPGKTKSVQLQRLAECDVLQSVAIATSCMLVAKNHRVDVKTMKGVYLGSLPDDIAFRLQKLLKLKNTYTALVQSTSKNSCVVFIKETYRSPDALYSASFPTSSGNHSLVIAEDVVLEETNLDMLGTQEAGMDEENEDTSTEEFATE